ncbi:MAG TPA: Holliday junction resolvase RuvX [bacterium]|nr:Holliday junction resolvase RuvX [Myxococcales bacterium]OQA60332.1 MAG: putative Holliday junction resolvase [bacterium ADurb.Bin270]HPW45288.1 Holliday junction resolvase RuvX [bacterium]HQG13123.1 Holliday junction resolvase RuvX [bacterium]HQH80074.1 Holliday junction resolvase RuvX [bacterium]
MRIICLDVGEKRIGVAASDPFGWTAQPVEVITRKKILNDFKRIEFLCRELSAELLLIGIPLDAEGGVGLQARKVRKFADKLLLHLEKSGITIPMEYWDERYSTAEAERRLVESDLSRAKRKRVIDKMAAVVILEGYLFANGDGK